MRLSLAVPWLGVLVLAAGCGGSGGTGGSASGPAGSASAPTTPATSTASSSTPPASASPSSSSAQPSGPGSFRITDVSFVSVSRGWAIGAGRLSRTTDGGASWTSLPAPPARVTHVRFATAEIGYAWRSSGPLWMTADGGRTWQRGGLGMVVSLEVAAGTTWALAGEQPYPGVWRATAGSTGWTKVGGTPDRSGTLDVHGDVAYVVGQQGAGPIAPSLDVWSGHQPVRNEKLPCAHPPVYVPWIALGASTDGSLVMVCNVEQPRRVRLAYTSANQAHSWATLSPPPGGEVTGATAVKGAVFAWGKDLLVLRSGRWTTSLHGPGPNEGFALVGFEDDTHGVALDANGVLRLTTDAGRSWHVARV